MKAGEVLARREERKRRDGGRGRWGCRGKKKREREGKKLKDQIVLRQKPLCVPPRLP